VDFDRSPGALARPAAGVSALRDMSVLDTAPDKYGGATRDALQQLDRPYYLGTDADGAVHHHSPYDDRVVVVGPDGTIEHVEALDGRDIETWVDFIRDRRAGWQNLNLRDSYGEIVNEAFES
jgi:hypothetical protein